MDMNLKLDTMKVYQIDRNFLKVESSQHCAIFVPFIFISRVDISHIMAPHLALCGDLRNDPYN